MIDVSENIVNLINVGLKLLPSSWLLLLLLSEILSFEVVVKLEVLNLVGPSGLVKSKKYILDSAIFVAELRHQFALVHA